MTRAIEHRIDDGALLERFVCERSDDAFAELVHRHLDLVHSAALRQVNGNHEAARDVAQAVFLELARQADRLVRHPALSGWLYQVTARVAARHVRTEVRRQRREQLAFAMQQDSPTHADPESEAAWETSLLGRVLDDALQELAESDRVAILLRHFERRPLAEIGARLGLTENAARMRIERALEKLRSRLAQRGVVSTASMLSATLMTEAVKAAPNGLATSVALAAAGVAVAPSASLGFLTLTTMSSLKWASGLVLVGAMTSAFLWQHQRLRQLQDENRSLRTQVEAASQTAPSTPVPIIQSLDADARQAELLRLRSEVAQWRAAAQRAPRAGAATASTKPAPAPLANLGNQTPSDAATTLFWALSQRDEAQFTELIYDPAELPSALAPKLHQALFRNQLRNYADKTFTQVESLRTNDNGSISLDFGFVDPATGEAQTTSVQLRSTPNGWKLDAGLPPPEMLQAAQAASPAP